MMEKVSGTKSADQGSSSIEACKAWIAPITGCLATICLHAITRYRVIHEGLQSWRVSSTS